MTLWHIYHHIRYSKLQGLLYVSIGDMNHFRASGCHQWCFDDGNVSVRAATTNAKSFPWGKRWISRTITTGRDMALTNCNHAWWEDVHVTAHRWTGLVVCQVVPLVEPLLRSSHPDLRVDCSVALSAQWVSGVLAALDFHLGFTGLTWFNHQNSGISLVRDQKYWIPLDTPKITSWIDEIMMIFGSGSTVFAGKFSNLATQSHKLCKN